MRESGYPHNNRNYNRNYNRNVRNRNSYDGYADREDGLVIEDNTIYEIDLDCYKCLREQRKKML